jgi:hypothetical protein
MASKRFEGRIREGMVVVTADGESLGKVRRVSGDTFETENGGLVHQRLTVACDEVLDVQDDDVFLSTTTEALMARCAQGIGVCEEPVHEEEPVGVSAKRKQAG